MSKLSKNVFQAAQIGVLGLTLAFGIDQALSGVAHIQEPKEKAVSPCEPQPGKKIPDLCDFNI